MGNTILTHDILAQNALFNVKNNLTFTRNVFTGYKNEFHSRGRFQVGDAVRVELPNKYRTKSGATMDPVNLFEQNNTVTVDVHRHVAFQLLETELTQDIEDFSRKHGEPVGIALADIVDSLGMDEHVNLYNVVGDAGSNPASFGVLADAMERAANEAWPMAPRVAIISPKAEKGLMDGELKNLFNQAMVNELVRKGFRGTYANFEFFMDQHVKTLTNGTRADSGITVKTTSSDGDTSIVLQGLGASETIALGETFTVNSVAGVNPVSGDVWEGNALRRFVATALATADGSGDITVNVAPTIYSSTAGEDTLPYQTVNDLPATSDAVVNLGSLSTGYPYNVFMHKDCFAMTMVPFIRPRSAGKSIDWGQATSEQLGLSITVASQFDITNYRENSRFDILFGWDTIRRELGIRMIGE